MFPRTSCSVYLDRKDFIYKQNKTYFADADAIPSRYTFITGYEKKEKFSFSKTTQRKT